MHIQLIIHMVRSERRVSWKDDKAVTGGLKKVYQAPQKQAAPTWRWISCRHLD
uniref:hypothetical protein n=1 Tax=Erwinia pyrifoliae TaxID=79967 RepID=UPI003F68AE31